MSKTLDNIEVGDRFRENSTYVWEIIDTNPPKMRLMSDEPHNAVDEHGVYTYKILASWIVHWIYLGNYSGRRRRPIQTIYGRI